MDEAEEAYQDVQDVVEGYGQAVKLLRNTEANTTRDSYNSIINRNPSGVNFVSIMAFPIRQNPSIKLLESIGIREKTDIIFYFSLKTLEAAGLSIDSFDLIRNTIESRGVTYKLTSKNEYSQFASRMLYVVVGGVRN